MKLSLEVDKSGCSMKKSKKDGIMMLVDKKEKGALRDEKDIEKIDNPGWDVRTFPNVPCVLFRPKDDNKGSGKEKIDFDNDFKT
jgi:hypothetical protein